MSHAGQMAVVLHAHLPYIRHPERPQFYEESWLFEAIAETYVPLLRMMDAMWQDGVDFRLTMSVTPPLCEMLSDPLLCERFGARLTALERVSAREADKHASSPYADATKMYVDELAETRRCLYDRWGGSLLAGLKSHQDRGRLEIITCGATHGYLPLLATDEGRRAQVSIACDNHERHFGRRPRGIWLPECAYAPGLDQLLADEGIRFFFLEKHGLLNATPSARFGTARPVLTPSGVSAFARDPECSNQVWSAEAGYPGDGLYREFYRDLGYEAPEEELEGLLTGGGHRHPIGIKVHRITGKVKLDAKEPYVPAWARERAAEHAGNFLFNRQAQVRRLREVMDAEPIVVAPFDAELFGHWWFEGPRFLEYFFRKAACDQHDVKITTPWEFLEADPVLEVVQPSTSSWGDKGYYEVWLNGQNAWIWPRLHRAEEEMIELVERFGAPTDEERRALNQAGRELLLAQSSDWPFLLTTATAGDYPKTRTLAHLGRFEALRRGLLEGRIDVGLLDDSEWRDPLFPKLDYRAWARESVTRPGAGTAVTSA